MAHNPIQSPMQSPERSGQDLGEFELIQSIFQSLADGMAKTHPLDAPILGIGDDCAIIAASEMDNLAVTSDMLIAGRHFFADADPYLLGRKSLAVNLSDLAAMGAKPTGFTLALALPEAQQKWLQSFAKGLFDVAKEFNCHLIGGDTCKGPLAISITAFGKIPRGQSILRSGAKVGDEIWVSNTVGDARLALAAARNEWPLNLNADEQSMINARLHSPTPRVELGMALRGIASAALDISDGLLGDLKHILKASGVNAEINIDAIPCSSVLRKQSLEIRRLCSACGGDDYELCFTAHSSQNSYIEALSRQLNIPLTRIGSITNKKDGDQSCMILKDQSGKELSVDETKKLLQSFDHFYPSS